MIEESGNDHRCANNEEPQELLGSLSLARDSSAVKPFASPAAPCHGAAVSSKTTSPRPSRVVYTILGLGLLLGGASALACSPGNAALGLSCASDSDCEGLACSDGACDEIECALLTTAGTSSDDRGTAIAIDRHHDIYVVGSTSGEADDSPSSGYIDALLTKVDSSGNPMWSRLLGTNEYDVAYGVAIDELDNVYVAGSTERALEGNTYAGLYDIYLAKYTPDGTLQWTSQYGTSGLDGARGVVADGAGSIYVTGGTPGDLDGNLSSGDFDIFLTRFALDGTKLWTTLLGTFDIERGNAVTTDSEGRIYVTGFTEGELDESVNVGWADVFVAAFTPDGEQLWTRQFGTYGFDTGEGIVVDETGSVYVTGFVNGDLGEDTSLGGTDIFVAKFDNDGTMLWTRQLGTGGNDESYGIAINDAGHIYITGVTSRDFEGNASLGGDDAVVATFNAQGETLWTKQLGTEEFDEAQGIAIAPDGVAWIVGLSFGDLGNNQESAGGDLLLARVCESM